LRSDLVDAWFASISLARDLEESPVSENADQPPVRTGGRANRWRRLAEGKPAQAPGKCPAGQASCRRL